MKRFSAAETAARLPYPALVGSIAAILRSDQAIAPKRLHLALPGGMLLVMPATDAALGVTKLVTVHPGNAALGLPTVQGDVAVLDARTGERLGTLDGPVLTARRTAALSLLAARLLAPAPRGPLLLVGAGVQAREHLEAFQTLGLESVVIVSRTPARAQGLAEQARALGLRARVADEPASALADCPLVVTATTSARPVLPDDPALLRPDHFIAAVGAYTPAMAEIPPRLLRACRVYCDTLEGGLNEAGDVIQAGLGASDLTPLSAVLDLAAPPPGPIVFKSLGHALFDLAAAITAFGR